MLVNVNSEVIFDASASSDDSDIVKYLWQFGEDPENTLEGVRVTYSFPTKGVQPAILTVFDQNGQSDTVKVKVHVFDTLFLMKAMSFSLLLLLLAFYLLYRYNRPRRSGVKELTKKASGTKSPSKKKK